MLGTASEAYVHEASRYQRFLSGSNVMSYRTRARGLCGDVFAL